MNIRLMEERDKKGVIEMMKVFYASLAVHTNGSNEIFKSDVEECINNSPYLEGYVLEDGEKLIGYMMVAKSYSTEFGKPCVWIEDIYLVEDQRGKGLGGLLLKHITEKYKNAVVRLEADKENGQAIKAYKKAGFKEISYLEMIKL